MGYGEMSAAKIQRERLKRERREEKRRERLARKQAKVSSIGPHKLTP
jgi:hypothetical protein